MPRSGADPGRSSPLVPELPGQLEAFPLHARRWRPSPLAAAIRLPAGYPRPRWQTPLPPTAVATFGPAVARYVKAEHGFVLDRWQRYTLSLALAVDRVGQLVHSIYLASTGRQNGKSRLSSGLIGWALEESPAELDWQRIASLAGDRAQARIIYAAVRAIAESPRRRDRYSRITHHGGITARSGAVYDVLSRDAPRTARGLSLDLAVLDEVLVQTSMDLWLAVEPTMTARPHPLALGLSTAGDARSVLLRAWFDHGLAVIAGAPAQGFGMSWWAAQDAAPSAANIRAANPALADGRLSVPRILASRVSMSEVGWAREHLNLWADVVEEWLPAGLWALRAAAQPDRAGARVALGIESPASWRRASITVAIEAGELLWVGVAAELEAGADGTLRPAQLVAELDRQWAAWSPDAVAFSRAWAGAPHIESWAAGKDAATHPLDGPALRRSSVLARAELVGGRLWHAADALLATQAATARPRGNPGGDDWYLSVRDSPGEVDAIRAAIWAAGALLAPTEAPSVQLYVPGSSR